jgi:hypothetical protein
VAAVSVGKLDPKLSLQQITLEPDMAGTPDDSQSLQKPIDPDGFVQAAQRRMYVSRIRGKQ